MRLPSVLVLVLTLLAPAVFSAANASVILDGKVASGAGLGAVPINADTGVNRLKIAVDWAKPRGLKLALMETGMPVDDPRWQEEFQRLVNYARDNDVEVFAWAGGNHWSFHNSGITNVPGWHENKTVEAAMSGVMKATASVNLATTFADGPGYATAGSPVNRSLTMADLERG